MSPDSTESRLGRLEEKVAKLEQRVEDRLGNLAEDTSECRAGIDTLKAQIEEMRRTREAEKIAALEVRTREQAQERQDKEAQDAQAKKDRKADLKWLVLTMLATGTLTTGALTLLLR